MCYVFVKLLITLSMVLLFPVSVFQVILCLFSALSHSVGALRMSLFFSSFFFLFFFFFFLLFFFLSSSIFFVFFPFLSSIFFSFFFSFFFHVQCRVSINGRCPGWTWLSGFSGVALSCFTLSRWTIFPDVTYLTLHRKPRSAHCSSQILYSLSCVRKPVSWKPSFITQELLGDYVALTKDR